MTPDQSERHLLDRCRRGDQDAFAQLYETYRSQAYGTALLINFRADQPFRPWLFRILTNEALRLARRRRLWLPLADLLGLEPASPLPTPEFAALDRERAEELWQAVSALSAAARATVVLRYYAGLTEEELSRALGVAPGTVKSRLYRAREQLRSTLPTRWNEEEQYV